MNHRTFAAGYAYWTGHDVLDPPDTPPATRILYGWVPIVYGAMPLERTKAWPDKDAYSIGNEILAQPGASRLLFYSRLPFVIFPLLLVLLMWTWGRELFGAAKALA